MSNSFSRLQTIDLDALTTITGGAGGENGGGGSERPREKPGLTPGQKIGVGILGGLGILFGGQDWVPTRRNPPPPPKPPTTITQPKFGTLPLTL